MTNAGRPMTGFLRPGTSSANRTSMNNERGVTAMKRMGTASGRGVTAVGSRARLNTATLVPEIGGPFINVDKIDLKKYAAQKSIARTLFDYIDRQLNHPKKALELALHALQLDQNNWFWNAQVGKCYLRLGLLRDAETHLIKSLDINAIIPNILLQVQVFTRQRQLPNAMKLLDKYLEIYPESTALIVGKARLYEYSNDFVTSNSLYRKALSYDASSIEAIACLGANAFYSDQPEVAFRFYVRLLNMGLNECEVWANIALASYYSNQFDIAFGAFQRALDMANEEELPDIWYNIGHAGVGIGDLDMALIAWKNCLAVDPDHVECLNNMAVLEMRQNRIDSAKNHLTSALMKNEVLYEPYMNYAILSLQQNDYITAYQNCQKVLEIVPEQTEARSVLNKLQNMFL